MPQYMYHVTSKPRKRPIRERGLLCRYATGKRPAVWVVKAQDVWWAFQHVAQKPHGRNVDLVAIRVDVSGYVLKRHSSPRCYWISEDVPPARLTFLTPVLQPEGA